MSCPTILRNMGTAIRNDASLNKVDTPNNILSGAKGNVTLSFWLRPKSVCGVFKSGSGSFRLDTWGGQFNLEVRSETTGTASYYYGVPIPLFKWSMITIVVDKANDSCRVYRNNVLLNTFTVLGGLHNSLESQVLQLLKSASAVREYDGLMDEFRVWVGKAFTHSDVSDLYFRNIFDKKSLRLEYLFDEGLGLVALDTSGNSNHGTIVEATYSEDTPIGMSNLLDENAKTSLIFDGVNDSVSVPNLNITNAITISAYVKPKVTTVSGDIFGRAAGISDVLEINGSGFLRWRLALTISSFDVISTYKPIPNKWIRVTATFDSVTGLGLLYVNGNLVGSNAGTGSLLNTGGWTVGSLGISRYWNGSIKQVNVWKRAFTKKEVENSHYYNTVPKQDLVLALQLNEGAGLIATDTSGLENNGTISGAIWGKDMPLYPKQFLELNARASLLFDGVDDSCVITPVGTSSPLNITGDFTYSGYFKTRRLSGLRQTIINSNENTNDRHIVQIGTSGRLEAGRYDGVTYTAKSIAISANTWYFFAFVRRGSEFELHVNNVQATSATASLQSDDTGLSIGSRPGVTPQTFDGKLKNIRAHTRALSPDEIFDLKYKGVVPPDGLALELKVNEGAGLITYDSSGKGYSGTISGAVWSTDLPSYPPKKIGGNLVYNGDFSVVPPFTAATTGNDRVIDGTAAGASTAKLPSQAKRLFGWKMNTYGTTTPAVQYENGGLKVSGLACKERVNLTLAKRVYTDLNEFDDIQYNLIKVKPLTTYKVSVRMKTEVANAVGTPGLYGAMVRWLEHSSTAHLFTGVVTGATNNNKIATKTDWTTYTKKFTTAAGTRYINIDFGIYGDASNYADITAYFDDITLFEVDAITFKPIAEQTPISCP